MNIDILRNHCLEKKEVTETFPFDENTLVFKVAGKMFCLIDLESPFSTNLKCDPERAIELREKYDAVIPGFHMNKTHWNTVEFDGTIKDDKILEMVDHSYDMVVKGLKKADRERLLSKP